MYKNASDIEPCKSLRNCERPVLYETMAQILDEMNTSLKTENEALRNSIAALEQALNSSVKSIAALEQALNSSVTKLEAQKMENEKSRKADYEALKMSFEAQLEAQNKSIAMSFEAQLEAQNNSIAVLTNNVTAQNKYIAVLTNNVTAQNKYIAVLTNNVTAQNKSIAVLTNNVNGIRVALTPATFQSMAETCIYKQAEGLTALLISKGMSISNGQEGLQYRWSQVGMKVLNELLVVNSRKWNVHWERDLFGGKNNSNHYSQELRTEAICRILSGLSFFVQTVPSSTLLSWPPDRNTVVHDGNFLHAVHGPFDSENEIDDEQKVAEQEKLSGQIQSWAPAEIPALQVPKGGTFEDEQTRRQVVEPFLDSLLDDLKAKIPQGNALTRHLVATKKSILRKLCR